MSLYVVPRTAGGRCIVVWPSNSRETGEWFWACSKAQGGCGVAADWAASPSAASDAGRDHLRVCPTVLANLDRLGAAVMAVPQIQTHTVEVHWCSDCCTPITDVGGHIDWHVQNASGS